HNDYPTHDPPYQRTYLRSPQVPPRRRSPPPTRAPLPLNAYMLHNLAHIELNAIDLAWDTLVRFSPLRAQLGEAFFADFAHVADDESRHLGWVLQRLAELGHAYGDMPAHDLLWRDALKTSGDVTARLAVVPMVQEARGLDAGPRLVDRLKEMGDARSALIVDKIAEEELAHVAVGVTWFLHVCRRSGVDPGESFQGLIQQYCQDTLKGPFNHAARAVAGVPRHWYDTSAPPPQNGKHSSALESKAKLEAKRRGAKLFGEEGMVGLERGSEMGEQSERSNVESSGVLNEVCGPNEFDLREVLVEGEKSETRSGTSGRGMADGAGQSKPEADKKFRREERKGSVGVREAEVAESKAWAIRSDLHLAETESLASGSEDVRASEQEWQRSESLIETEPEAGPFLEIGESTVVEKQIGIHMTHLSRIQPLGDGQENSRRSSRFEEDFRKSAQQEFSPTRKTDTPGDFRSGENRGGEAASDAKGVPVEDIEALSQVRERLALLVAMEQERASA
ncbi:hypothetical protein KFL_000700310, partial [Klebsormidium nitens]